MGSNLDLSGLSSISKLTLWGVLADNATLPWNSMTHIDLSQVQTNMAFGLLFSCPNLVQFRFENAIHSFEEFEPLDVENPVILPHLKVLCWENVGRECDTLLLLFLRAPALELFSWVDGDDIEEHEDHLLAAFCSRLPASLEAFTMISESPNGFPLIALPPDTRVKEIVCEHRTSNFTPAILASILAPLKPRKGPEGQPQLPFPRLDSLVIKTWSKGGRDIQLPMQTSMELVITMAARAAALGRIFTLDVEGLVLNWNSLLFRGPLYGGENLILRIGKDKITPTWYQALVPQLAGLFSLNELD
ncbi:hypothetical protein NP233_g9194 [Leucocoprinus birnbaumii]|uniref:F-box protein n=1 Tax=Leucocoprinus birnbaumii TaxID=56174 RepID=A0AAD5VRJ5_9AGAR|nr:hypothetical protein NP233_g9194 [Leucocoprinus birnbaumii]